MLESKYVFGIGVVFVVSVVEFFLCVGKVMLVEIVGNIVVNEIVCVVGVVDEIVGLVWSYVDDVCYYLGYKIGMSSSIEGEGFVLVR